MKNFVGWDDFEMITFEKGIPPYFSYKEDNIEIYMAPIPGRVIIEFFKGQERLYPAVYVDVKITEMLSHIRANDAEKIENLRKHILFEVLYEANQLYKRYHSEKLSTGQALDK